nr:carbonic anhydrase-related protein 10-like [Cherax quadricarinatus]
MYNKANVSMRQGPSSSSPPGIDWSQWWTYGGISGPRFWGVINPAWGMCREGRRQSPINIDPKTLLFDPNLSPFTLDKVTGGGELLNTGHSVEWRAAHNAQAINVTGGPLSYAYTITHARLHFGERDQQGSEHLLDNKAFPAELQLYGYNSQLYRNFSQASAQVYGVVGIALLIQICYYPFRVSLFFCPLSNLYTFPAILPSHNPTFYPPQVSFYPPEYYFPSCVQMRQLRALRQGNSTLANAPLSNNFRPVQTAHHRTIRTNINFTNKQSMLLLRMLVFSDKTRYDRSDMFYKIRDESQTEDQRIFLPNAEVCHRRAFDPAQTHVEMRPVEMRPVEMRPVEMRPVEMRPVEMRPVEMRPVEMASSKVHGHAFYVEEV